MSAAMRMSKQKGFGAGGNGAPTGVTGVRTLSQMKVPSRPSHHNSRLLAKITATSDYFLEKVDPLIGDCIAYMLQAMPPDVPRAMLQYFNDLKETSKRPEFTLGSNSGSLKPRRDQKLFLASSIGPIIAKLINRIAFARPEAVIDFLLVQLNEMVLDDGMTSNSGLEAVVTAAAVDLLAKSSPFSSSSGGLLTEKVRPDSAPITTEKLLATSPRGQLQQHSNSYSNLPTAAASGLRAVPAESRIIQIAVVGSGGGGKTSLLNLLQGDPGKKTRPTNGFSPISMSMSMDNIDVTVRFYDLGGGEKIRSIWDQYYHDVHCVMYVFDGASDQSSFTSSVELFHNTVNSTCLAGKPILIVANKQDIAGCVNAEAVRAAIGQPSAEYRCVGSSALVTAEDGSVLPANSDELEKGVEWLLQTVNGRYEALHCRVLEDTKLKLQLEAAKRLEKERRVLRNKILSAFPTQVKSEFITPDTPASADDCFSEVDGNTFLAGEIGVDVSELPNDARAAAASVGYQRLALQMLGALNVPVSKKKAPLSWQQILDIVGQLRSELGLAPVIVSVGR
jgi:ADP-ribosylation factor-like protein 13B